MTDQPKSVFAKLVEITTEVVGVEARGRNDFLRTSYVLEDDVINAVRSKLTERNLVMLPSLVSLADRAAKTSKGKDTTVTDMVIDFTFCDGDTGDTFVCRWAGRGEDPTDKGLAMAETSALRTFLLKAFLITTGSPGDGPPAPARADGAETLTPELYDSIVSTWKDAGSDHAVLTALLDSQKIPTNVEGQELALSQRAQMLTSLQAIAVHKSLADLKKAKDEAAAKKAVPA